MMEIYLFSMIVDIVNEAVPKLARAIIIRALKDFTGVAIYPVGNKEVIGKQAKRWLTSDDCEMLCDVGGLDHRMIMRNLRGE